MKHSRSCFFLASDTQTAGGAAGEDRVQVVWSQNDDLLFCAIFDGFNGRDAADFLAAKLYKRISRNLENLAGSSSGHGCPHAAGNNAGDPDGVVRVLREALAETEAKFLAVVEQEFAKEPSRPDLVMVGSCVLVVLVYRQYLYTMNLGDSRAVLATQSPSDVAPYNKEEAPRGGGNATSSALRCVQLTRDHVVKDKEEHKRLVAAHPNEPHLIRKDRVKGKLGVTRAFGAGFLKEARLNNMIQIPSFKVQDMRSPPYISAEPNVCAHKIQACEDEFVVMASDGLFEFFTNDEVVKLVKTSMLENRPNADPSQFLLNELLIRAASRSGIPLAQLHNVEIGRRREYHDDVTVMVVTLGSSTNGC